MSTLPSSSPQDDIPKIVFHQLKSTLFRVIHADGVWCSVGPHEHIHLAFFNERWPIPTKTSYILDDNAQLGEEILDEREIRSGYIREMEVDIVLDFNNARALHQQLGKYLAVWDEQQAAKSARGVPNAVV